MCFFPPPSGLIYRGLLWLFWRGSLEILMVLEVWGPSHLGTRREVWLSALPERLHSEIPGKNFRPEEFSSCTRVSCWWNREFSGCCWRRIRSSNRGIRRWWLQNILGCSAVMFLCSSSFYNTEYTETQGVNWNFKNSITSELSHSCSFHSAALLTTPRRARPRSLGNCMLCVCPMWDVVFLRFAAVEQINSGCCLQRCDQGYRQPTFCFTWMHFQQPLASYSRSRHLVLGTTFLKCVALQRSVAHKDGHPNVYIYKHPGLKTKEPQVLLQRFILNSQQFSYIM